MYNENLKTKQENIKRAIVQPRMLQMNLTNVNFPPRQMPWQKTNKQTGESAVFHDALSLQPCLKVLGKGHAVHDAQK